MLIKPNSPIHIEIVELDTNGRFIILCLKTAGETSFTLLMFMLPPIVVNKLTSSNLLLKK